MLLPYTAGALTLYTDSDPYGTPNSLCLVSPQYQIPADQLDLSTIPDSPSSRGPQATKEAFRFIIDVDRETTKSESPELTLSLDEVPSHEQDGALVEQKNGNIDVVSPESTPGAAAVDQVNDNIDMSQSSDIYLVLTSASEPKSIEQSVDGLVNSNNGGNRQRIGLSGFTPRPPLKRKQPSVDVAFGEQVRPGNGGDIYDPIESDSDSLREKQSMHSVKRPRLNHTILRRFASPRVALNLGKDSNEDGFLKGTLPSSRDNGRRTALGELTFPKNDNTGAQQHYSLNQETGLDQLQDEASEQQEITYAAKANPDMSQPLSQVTTAGVQDAKTTAKTSHKSTQDTSLEGLVSFKQADNTRFSSSINGVQTSDAEPHAEGARSEELADVDMGRQSKMKNMKSAGAERIHKMKAKEKQLADEERTVERHERERKARDKALSNQAEKIALAADGAKLLEAERLGKRKPLGTVEPSTAAIAVTPKNPISDSTALIETKLVSATSITANLKGAILSSAPAETASPPENILHAKAPAATGATKISSVSRLQRRDTTSAEPKKRTDTPRGEEAKIRRKELDKKRVDRVKAAKEERSYNGGHVNRRAQANADEVINEAEKRRESVKVDGKDMTANQHNIPVSDKAVRKSKPTSDGRSRQSSTLSDISSTTDQGRKTMTPALPRSLVTKSFSNQAEVMSSSPSAVRSAKDLDTPLRSALKQGSSAVRRSVSFKDSLEDSLGPKSSKSRSPIKTDPNTLRSRPFKSMVEINEEILSATSIQLKSPKPTSASNRSGRKLAKTPAARKEMVQMKLNVTRDIKGKGRMIDPPIPAVPIAKTEIEDSSSSSGASVSSFLSNEEVGPNGSSKVGPSSRKSARRMRSSFEEVTASPDPSDALIDPDIYKIKVEADNSTTPGLPIHSTSGSDTLSQQALTSRSPAQATRGTMPLSSDSGDSGDVAGLESASESGSCKDSSSHEGSSSSDESGSSSSDDSDNRLNGNATPVASNGFEGPKVSSLSPKGTPVTQTSHRTSASGSPPRGTIATNCPVKGVNETVDNQPQEELAQSLPSAFAQTPVTETESGEKKPATTTYPKLDRHGRLPNGTRPAYYRYPKLSELKKMADAESIYRIPASQNTAPAPTEDTESAKSSSEDEDSSSDNEETADGSHISSKSNAGGIPGLRGVIKRMLPLKATQ